MGCCNDTQCAIEAMRDVRQRKTLWLVLVLNAVMFVVEAMAGLSARSNALLADSLDMLGDALVYGLGLYAVGRGAIWRARAAGVKGVIMAVFGFAVLVETGHRFFVPAMPLAQIMAAVALLALIVNALCMLLLLRHRHEDINMRSTWLCSRNDLIANSAVLLAAGAVGWSGNRWPDLVVGMGIAALFLRSALHVLRDAKRELRVTAGSFN